MNIDKKIEARLRVLEECIKEAIKILLDAYNEKKLHFQPLLYETR